MVAIALGSSVGHAGRASTALLLALGLAQQDLRVEFVQVVSKASGPLFNGVFLPPFDFSAISIDTREDWEEGLADKIAASRAQGRHVVIDLPATSIEGRSLLLTALDMLLVPVRPGALERRGAAAFWEDVMRTLLEIPVKHRRVSVKLLPVGWGDSAAAVSEVIRLRSHVAEAHRYFLPPPEIVLWNVPLILPRALEALTDGGKLARFSVLDPIARQLTEVLGCWGNGLKDTLVGALPIPEPTGALGRGIVPRSRPRHPFGNATVVTFPSKSE